jgi:hypothetical protein
MTHEFAAIASYFADEEIHIQALVNFDREISSCKTCQKSITLPTHFIHYINAINKLDHNLIVELTYKNITLNYLRVPPYTRKDLDKYIKNTLKSIHRQRLIKRLYTLINTGKVIGNNICMRAILCEW